MIALVPRHGTKNPILGVLAHGLIKEKPGHRSCKGTYSAEKRQKQGLESTTSVNLSSAHHQLGLCKVQ